MPPELSKSVKRRARELVTIAWERELSAELEKLEHVFARWRAKDLTALEVSDAIHAFHDGEARELFKDYAGVSNSRLEMVVASAIHRGVISEAEAGPQVVEAVARSLAMFRSAT